MTERLIFGCGLFKDKKRNVCQYPEMRLIVFAAYIRETTVTLIETLVLLYEVASFAKIKARPKKSEGQSTKNINLKKSLHWKQKSHHNVTVSPDKERESVGVTQNLPAPPQAMRRDTTPDLLTARHERYGSDTDRTGN
ncbi:hypothetical protein TURU_091877 [Turdus rufiventris]|nr:hypothetical protein TURU_091877 [Turdus rufiventris]